MGPSSLATLALVAAAAAEIEQHRGLSLFHTALVALVSLAALAAVQTHHRPSD